MPILLEGFGQSECTIKVYTRTLNFTKAVCFGFGLQSYYYEYAYNEMLAVQLNYVSGVEVFYHVHEATVFETCFLSIQCNQDEVCVQIVSIYLLHGRKTDNVYTGKYKKPMNGEPSSE